jgi:transcriptional regulator
MLAPKKIQTMHSIETINQFLNLRAQGWSFARIADHLHVSKPTLIDWSRKHQSELAVTNANHERSVQESAQASHALQLEHLTLFHKTLRQEIIKRTLQTLSDEEIQTMADEIQHQIEKLASEDKK